MPAKDSSQSHWLLVAIHGSGGSCHDFEGLEEIFDFSNLNYLYLNGPIRSYSGYRWYSDLGPRTEAYTALQYAFDYVARAGFPPKQTFMLGFSQGAALTIEFGARYKELLAGYVAISGRVENLPGLIHHGNPQIIRNGEWLITHGTQDYNLSIDIIRQQVQQMREAGFHIDYQEYDKKHEFESTQELPYIRDWIAKKML